MRITRIGDTVERRMNALIAFATPGSLSAFSKPSVIVHSSNRCRRPIAVKRIPRRTKHESHRQLARCMQVDDQVDDRTENTESVSESNGSPEAPRIQTERYIAGAAYVAFLAWGFILAPGDPNDLGQIGLILKGQLNNVNDLFFAIFNLLGSIATSYAVLLSGGAPRQSKLPTGLFSLGGMVIGFAALGPYLIGRDYVPSVSREEVNRGGRISRVLESRWFSVGTVIYSLWIYAFAFGLFTPGSVELHDLIFYSAGVDLGRLFMNDRFACNTMVDAVILSIGMWGPLTEDMKRRGWFVEGRMTESVLTALSFLSAPGLGTALYLVLRPRLPSNES